LGAKLKSGFWKLIIVDFDFLYLNVVYFQKTGWKDDYLSGLGKAMPYPVPRGL